MNGTAADILLADVGAWGLAAISALTFLALRALDRARLVAPPKAPAERKDEPASKPGEGQRLSVLGDESGGEQAA